MEYFIYNVENLTDADYEKWFSLMTKNKQNRVSKYKNIERRKCAVAGEMLVKKYIGSTFNIAPQSLVILEHENGKPYIQNFEIHFNVSHCENIIVYTFSNEEVGIDIEKIRPISLSVLKRFFSLKEQEYVLGHTPNEEDYQKCDTAEILERFYKIYTLKEAICKKSGIGIKGLKNANALPFLDQSFKEKDYIISIIK